MGDLTWPVVRELVDDAIVISEEEIVSAMQLCYERMKVCSLADDLAIVASGWHRHSELVAACMCAGKDVMKRM